MAIGEPCANELTRFPDTFNSATRDVLMAIVVSVVVFFSSFFFFSLLLVVTATAAAAVAVRVWLLPGCNCYCSVRWVFTDDGQPQYKLTAYYNHRVYR